jgi:hypothetical protein
MTSIRKLEDFLSSKFDDKTVVLAVGSFLGGQSIIQKVKEKASVGRTQKIKSDGSTVGILDNSSGNAIVKYVNSTDAVKYVRFKSEEKMPFSPPKSFEFAGIFDDLDGSINPMIGGTNLYYVGVGGVIHSRPNDEQISTAAYLPFANPSEIFLAEKNKGTYSIQVKGGISSEKIILSLSKAQKDSLIESGWSSPSTNKAVEALVKNGFYDSVGVGARDRITGGIAQTVSGIRDNRQIVLNFAASHQADYCYLLLSEAGAEVIGQDGKPMNSLSYAMLSIAPSFAGDSLKLKERFADALKNYKGWNPGKVILKRVTE